MSTLRARVADFQSAVSDASDVSAVDEAARVLAQRVPFRCPSEPHGEERATLARPLPDWLRGQLLRVAPAFGTTPHWAASHWFDALGLAFAFELGGDQLRLRWSTLDCLMGAAAMSGKVPFAQFSSPNQRSQLTRLVEPIPETTDNANVNVIRMGEDWVSMTETPHQLVLDPATLRVRGRVRYHDALSGSSMLAHPIVSGGTLTNVATRLGPRTQVSLYRHTTTSRTREVLGTWTTRDYPYIHSFGLTARAGILIDHPLRLRPLHLLWSNRGIIEHFTWQADTPTRLVAIDLQTGAVRSHETEPLFCFHTVHAFETADATVLDLLAYEDASLIARLSLPRMAQEFPGDNPALVRLSIDRQSGKVTRRVLSDTRFEFPQVDWARAADAEQRFVFGAQLQSRGADLRSELVRVDVGDGTALRFGAGDCVLGEPVFVGAPERQREGEGVLLSVGSSPRGSALYVLDAASLDVITHAEFSTPLPLGFHGSFVPA